MNDTYYELQHLKHKSLPLMFHTQDIRPGAIPNTRLHWHENPEFLYCAGGEGEVISDADRLPFSLGDLITVNCNSPHTLNNTADAKVPLVYRCIIIDAAFCKENGVPAESLRFDAHTRDAEAVRLFHNAYRACTQQDEFQSLRVRAELLAFLKHMCANHIDPQSREADSKSVDAIKRVMSYIFDNYRERLTMKEAAEIAGFSVYHFSREFKKVTGRTFVTFLNSVRCENAARMIRSGTAVTDACFACGFHDPGYFCRVFTELLGVNPSSLKSKANKTP